MRHFILACALIFSLSAVPTAALATPAPDAYASAPEPGESPGNKVAPTPTEKEETPATSAPMEEPKNIGEAIEDVGLLVEAAKNGNWVLFAGILILLLIFLLDKVVKLKERVPSKAIPWVAAALGIVASIGAQLTTSIPWGQALVQGLLSGAVAVGLWELVFQHLKTKATESDSAPKG